MGFIEDLKSRNILAQITHEEELVAHLSEKKRSAYVGYDPTADSLHVGHLIPTLVMRRWQKAGHRAVIVLGGGTSQIGDPTGKTDMRKMLDADFRLQNIEKFRFSKGRFRLAEPEPAEPPTSIKPKDDVGGAAAASKKRKLRTKPSRSLKYDFRKSGDKKPLKGVYVNKE